MINDQKNLATRCATLIANLEALEKNVFLNEKKKQNIASMKDFVTRLKVKLSNITDDKIGQAGSMLEKIEVEITAAQEHLNKINELNEQILLLQERLKVVQASKICPTVWAERVTKLQEYLQNVLEEIKNQQTIEPTNYDKMLQDSNTFVKKTEEYLKNVNKLNDQILSLQERLK